MATESGQWDEANKWLHASIELSREAGEPPIPLVPATFALEALERNRRDDAVGQAEQALAAARERNSPFWESYALASLSLMTSLTTDDADTSLADQAVEIARTQHNRFLFGHALMSAGIGRVRTEPGAAVAVLDEAIAITRQDARSSQLNQAYLFRGLAHLRLGHIQQAAEDLGRALSVAYVGGNVYYVAIALTATAGILSRQTSQQTAAVRMLAVADRLRDEAGLIGAPREIAAQRRISDRLTDTIGPERYDQAWARGRQTSLDEIVAAAQAELKQLAA
jgi:tetratricopeptide (TPR) repeat protein